ncbi:MAG: TadE/TadG family type IV pilus assembly protein [Chloroflexota bacterium]
MLRLAKRQEGQAVVEFALIALVLFMVSLGIVIVGQAFYQYNAVSAAARFGARWGAVVGGNCSSPLGTASTSDFCTQLGSNVTWFWTQQGNIPLQGNGIACPSYSSAPSDYYTVSNYDGGKSTTIVGAVAHHFDSSGSSSGFMGGAVTPAFDLTQLKVCIQTSGAINSSPPGNQNVGATVYYPFSPVSGLLGAIQWKLQASSEYEVE